MSELSTITRDDSLADSSETDYLNWLEAQFSETKYLNWLDAQLSDDAQQLRVARGDVMADDQPLSVVDFDDEEMTTEELRAYVDQGKGRIRRAMGRALGRLNYRINGVYQTPGNIAEFDKELHARHARAEGDGIFRRANKFLGRNAIRIAGGFVGGVAATAYGTAITEHYNHGFHDLWYADAPQTTNVNTNPIIDASIPYQTLEQSSTQEVKLLGQVTNIYIGGHTQGDPIASGFIQSLKDAGIYQEGANNKNINWSAQMAPLSGDTIDMTTSDIEGGHQVAQAIRDANGGPVRILGFSQSTPAVARGLWEIANEPGNNGRLPDNVEVILQGSPMGPSGIGGSKYENFASPIIKLLNIETDLTLPPGGSKKIYMTDVADAIGNGGKQSGAKLLEMALGPGHRTVGPGNGILLGTYTVDGETVEVWGSPDGINSPLLRLARDNGFVVTPKAEAFMEALLPYTPPDATSPVYANAGDVSRTFGDMLDEATGNTGAAKRAIDGMMAEPGAYNALESYLGLVKTPDRLMTMANDPSTIPTELPQFVNEVKAAVDTTGDYLRNPNKLIDLGNAALKANGLPGLIPHLDTSGQASVSVSGGNQIADAVNNFKDQVQDNLQKIFPQNVTASAEVHTDVNVPIKPIELPKLPTPQQVIENIQKVLPPAPKIDIPAPAAPIELPPAPANLPTPEQAIKDLQHQAQGFVKNLQKAFTPHIPAAAPAPAPVAEVHTDLNIPVTPIPPVELPPMPKLPTPEQFIKNIQKIFAPH